MLDSFFESLRSTDAWKDYWDELSRIIEKVLSMFIHYDWRSLGKHFG